MMSLADTRNRHWRWYKIAPAKPRLLRWPLTSYLADCTSVNSFEQPLPAALLRHACQLKKSGKLNKKHCASISETLLVHSHVQRQRVRTLPSIEEQHNGC